MAQEILGRVTELEAVERFLDSVPAGPAALVIDGEPGIGKTTVWQAGVDAALAQGWTVLRAQPAESERGLAHAGLSDLLGVVLGDVRDQLPAPQRRGLEVALLRDEPDEPADPRAIAAGCLSVLAALAESGNVLVAIDDVQWLDDTTSRTLAFVARRLPGGTRMLLAQRTARAAELPFGLAEAQSERVVLGPLSLAALHHLLQSRLGVAPPRPMLLRIAQTSGGNPFYALEIARSLGAQAAQPGLGAPLPLPERLHDLVSSRVHAVSPQARDALVTAAALSRPTPDLVCAAVGAGAETALAEAEDAGIVIVDADRVRFTHPLLASAVYGSLPPGSRRRLHGQLARLVDDPVERARHLAQSETRPRTATAAELEEAARRAVLRGAQATAAALYTAAIRLTPAEDGTAAIRRIRGEAEALLACGHVAGARRAADRALERSPAGPDRAETLFLLAQIDWLDNPASAADRLEEALSHAGDDRRLRARIHAKRAALAISDQRLAVAHADAAIELLDPDEDPGLLAYALLYRLFYGAQTGLGVQPELLERALELEQRAGPEAERSSIVLIWYRCMDELEAARERAELELRWYRDRGDDGWAAEKAALLALAELHAGNWDLAERLVDESCATLEQIGGISAWLLDFKVRALIDAHRGRTERAIATLAPLIGEIERAGAGWFAAIGLWMLGFAQLAAGDPAAAAASFDRREEHLASLGVVTPLDGFTDADHGEALVALGELERAELVVERLQARGRSVPRLWIDVVVPRARALVLAARGEIDRALGALGELDDERAALLPFEHARALLLRGRLQRRLKQKREAALSLRQALDTFEHLGAPVWAEEARSELARVGLRRSDSSELTDTERRIAELAAAGLTNREIAKAAFVSPKTVEANLARVYRKLDISSRAELGARMGERARSPQT